MLRSDSEPDRWQIDDQRWLRQSARGELIEKHIIRLIVAAQRKYKSTRKPVQFGTMPMLLAPE